MKDQHVGVEGSTALLESMGVLRGLLDVSQLMVIVVDPRGSICFINSECEQVSGYEASDVIGLSAAELCLLPESTTPRADRAHARPMADRRFDHVPAFPLQTRSGEPRQVNWRTLALPGDSGVLAMGIDTAGQMGPAEQTALHRELLSARECTQTVLAHAIDGILIVDAQGVVQSVNPAAEKLFGREASELTGQHVKRLLKVSDSRSSAGKFRPFDLADAELRCAEVVANHRDGSLLETDLALAEFVENGQRRFICFIRDLRDFKRAERQAREHLRALAHMERLGAMNEITSGLAHEINQPLTAISATAEACLALLATRTDPQHGVPPQLQSALEQISLQARRAADIIGDLRAFVRREDVEDTRACPLDELIHAVLQLLKHDLDAAGIEVREKLCTPAATCAVNRVQIEQVIFNLVRNAIDAMIDSDGPRILTVASRVNVAGRTCTVRISDTGTGIAEEHMNELFNPFFTTKQHGLGQGLSICKSIVDAHRGRLTATCRAGGGASFTVVLPQADSVSA